MPFFEVLGVEDLADFPVITFQFSIAYRGFSIRNEIVQDSNCPGGGGGTRRKIGEGWAARFPKPLPYL